MTSLRPLFTAHDIPDLFNSLPTLFGFRPSESLIAIATHGPRRRFGFRMRADMPAAEHVDELAQVTAGHLHNNDAEGAIVLALTSRQPVARRLIAGVEERLGHIVPVVIARSDGRRYWVDDVPDFPAVGVPYDTSDHHLSIVEAVAAGQQILPDRAAVVARYAPVRQPRRGWLEHAADAESTRIAAMVVGSDVQSVVVAALSEVQPVVVAGLGGADIDDGAATRFAVWVSFAPVRQAIWEQIDRGSADAWHAFLVQMSARAVPPLEPAVLSLTSFAAWLSGNGTEALIAVERALRADPCFDMARLLLTLIENGVPPTTYDLGKDVRRAG